MNLTYWQHQKREVSIDKQRQCQKNEIKIAYLLASSFNRSKSELIGSTAVWSLTPLWAAFIDSAVDADDRWNIHTSTPWSRPNFTWAAGNCWLSFTNNRYLSPSHQWILTDHVSCNQLNHIQQANCKTSDNYNHSYHPLHIGECSGASERNRRSSLP